MIPVSLAIKGLYSFQEEQRIDFTKLVSAQLFGIFGTVGSGKSTILEAISFALFGSTERLNSRENRNYNMMNLKSDELLIDFEFRNYDEEVYRFVVKGKRHSSDFSKVNTFQRDAYQLHAGSWVPLGNITAETILGLSYENFRRTIIIPQGQFQEFLELGDKDRTNMLKELFHLGKYDFFLQTASLDKKNNEKIQYLSGQLAQYEETTPEHVAEKEAFASALSEALQMQRKELDEARRQGAAQEELKKLFNELHARKNTLEVLLQQEPAIQEKETLLGKYESCVQLFKSLITARQDTVKRLEEKQQQLDTVRHELAQTSSMLEADLKLFEGTDAAFRQIDYKRRQIEDLRKLIVIGRLAGEMSRLRQRIEAGEQKLITAQEKKKEAAESLAAIRKEIAAAKETLPDQSEMADVKAWFAQKRAIDAALLDAREEKQQIVRQQLAYRQALKAPDELIQELVPGPEDEVSEYIARLESQKNLNDTKSEAIREVNNQLLLREKLEEFARDLEDGKPCPLCGSEHHPHIMGTEHAREARSANDTKLENIRKQNAGIEQAIREASEYLVMRKALDMQEEQNARRLQKEVFAMQEHLQAFSWKQFRADDEAGFETIFQASRASLQKLDVLEKDLAHREKQLQNSEASIHEYDGLLQQIRNELTAKAAERQTLNAQLQHPVQAEEPKDPAMLEARAAALEKEIASIAGEHELLSKKITAAQQQQVVLKERVASLADSVAEYGQQLEKIGLELSKHLESSSFGSLEEVQELLAREVDTQALRGETERFRQSFFKAKEDVAELEKQAAGKTFDAEACDALVSRIAMQEKQIQEQHDLHTRESAILQKLREDLARKEELLKSLEGFRKRGDHLQVMKNLFKGSGFVNFVSTVYLQNLCEMANVRFYKLTRQQLRLEISESNDFMVRDYLNEGRLRSIKTLSGGQMFQAALSLALALAESIQKQNGAKQNFFFLDEGFGSQDKASLQMVFDSLKALREENRVIGVISHVEDLQQEIDMFLHLENDPETGSQIGFSWV